MSKKPIFLAALVATIALIAPALVAWIACLLPGASDSTGTEALPRNWIDLKTCLSHATSEDFDSVTTVKTPSTTRGQSGALFRGEFVFSAGWPLRCLKSGRRLYHDESVEDWGQFVLNSTLATSRPFDHTLPIVPVKTAYAIDSIVFGVALCSLFYGPPVFRIIAKRRRERRVGHCKACGYDLTGVPTGICPECGRQNIIFQPPTDKSDAAAG